MQKNPLPFEKLYHECYLNDGYLEKIQSFEKIVLQYNYAIKTSPKIMNNALKFEEIIPQEGQFLFAFTRFKYAQWGSLKHLNSILFSNAIQFNSWLMSEHWIWFCITTKASCIRSLTYILHFLQGLTVGAKILKLMTLAFEQTLQVICHHNLRLILLELVRNKP